MTPRSTLLATGLAVALLAGCAGAPSARAPDDPDVARMLAAVQAAGAREQSAIEVTPLVDPGVTLLRQQARSAVITGDYDGAAAKLAQALKQHPDSPEIIQQQAELALQRGDWLVAEQRAYRSWQLGPRLGPLCAKNWQTILEMRRLKEDAAGVATARKWIATCHVEGVHRY
ncbi:MAG TPA: tetratricopeptide repeat protein [Rhodanobacteraceae bacterium]|nr:tetratricopeptide repeat protein [Rhodanobacteraceae bacterium]